MSGYRLHNQKRDSIPMTPRSRRGAASETAPLENPDDETADPDVGRDLLGRWPGVVYPARGTLGGGRGSGFQLLPRPPVGVTAIAEGVETAEQRDILSSLA